VDISLFCAVEVDFESDLERANRALAARAADRSLSRGRRAAPAGGR
jgi:hypothetical protein